MCNQLIFTALGRLTRCVIVVVAMGCGAFVAPLHGQSLAEVLKYLEAPRHQPEIYLPYVADQARHDGIVLNMNALQTGMTTTEVSQFLGAPDEIEALFVQGERTEEIQGFRYTYLLERKRANEWGKAYEERWIHLNFNLNGQLASAEAYAIPGFKELVRELGLGFEFSMGLHETVKINELLIRLDFVLDAGSASAGEASQVAGEAASEARLSVSLPDRADNLKLNLGNDAQQMQQTQTYGTYRITLLAIPSSDRVSMVVE